MDGAATGIGGGSVADLGNLERWWNNPGIAAWSFVLFGCFLLNATLLLAFLVRPGLRTISNSSRLLKFDWAGAQLISANVNVFSLILVLPPAEPGNQLLAEYQTLATAATKCNNKSVEPGTLSTFDVIEDGLFCLNSRFVMNLTVSNLLTCAVLNPLLMMDGPTVEDGTLMASTTSDDFTSPFGSTSTSASNICAISEGATALVTTSSVLSVLLIAVDQYFAVVDPLRYRARVDKLKSAVLIVSIWLVSMTFGLVAALNPSPRSLWLSCSTLLNNSSYREFATSNVTATTEPSETSLEIPKISSLSSIDETSETTHSINQISRRRSFSSSLDAAQAGSNDEQTSSGIVFTVGLQPVESMLPSDQSNDSNFTGPADPQTNYLERERVSSFNGNLVASKFHDTEADRRRKSSCDLTDGSEIGESSENVGYNSPEASSSCFLTPIVTITPAPGKSSSLHRVASVRSTNSYINSLKHRISNGSLFRYREETRAARISALVIVMGLICWSPYVLLNMIKYLPRYSDYAFPHEYDVLALSFLILAAYVSPLLFGYRSRRVKRELRKFFCFHRELSYKNNRSLMAKKVLKRRHSSTLSHLEMDHRYNIFNCVYGRSRWPKEKVQFVQVPDTALAVETCRSSFSSGASTQISSTSTEEC
ncbi:hypothetical protein ALC56_02988 [Trachymyrmex septentrionalis]|uniref:G-protein coupled receptors family 1 profile domain-containing protein n=1 Tax=Trachymyrmex septentrionalis TaxID=34720 RepID=A0A195FQA2_9HYME|nr:hypothetical protein ALC56_02988 [Trachymyrmex septentrionalis]